MNLSHHTVVYGGSFNPPHMGHQMACLALLEGRAASEVWLVPAFVHPFGKPLAGFEHRLALCERLAEPFGGRVTVHDTEASLEGQGRTFDLMEHLRQHHPERSFALAMGADILGETDSWYRWEDLQALFPIVVLGRQGYPNPPGPAADLPLPAISSTTVRDRLAHGEPIAGLVPVRVADYIRTHGLYQPGSPTTK